MRIIARRLILKEVERPKRYKLVTLYKVKKVKKIKPIKIWVLV